MAMVDMIYWLPIDGSAAQAVGLVQRSAATWCHAVFITQTEWTRNGLSCWQHYKHCHYYCYYYLLTYLLT